MPVMKQSLSTLRTDPLRNFKFHVNIHFSPRGTSKSMLSLGFMNMSGLSAATEPIPYREGGDNTTQRKMPGQTNFGDITLSRGVIVGTYQSWYWLKHLFYVNQGGRGGNAPGGSNFRANMIIKVMEHPAVGGPGYSVPVKVAYKVYNVWPSVLAYGELDAGSNAILIEQMTLVNEGWDMLWAAHQGGTGLGNSVEDNRFAL